MASIQKRLSTGSGVSVFSATSNDTPRSPLTEMVSRRTSAQDITKFIIHGNYEQMLKVLENNPKLARKADECSGWLPVKWAIKKVRIHNLRLSPNLPLLTRTYTSISRICSFPYLSYICYYQPTQTGKETELAVHQCSSESLPRVSNGNRRKFWLFASSLRSYLQELRCCQNCVWSSQCSNCSEVQRGENTNTLCNGRSGRV